MIYQKKRASTSELIRGNYKRSRPQSWGQWATKAVAVSAGAQLGFIQVNVPGAVAGGVLASRAYDLTHQDENFESLTEVEGVSQTKTMGKYTGYVKKPVSKKNNTYEKAGRTGGLTDTETFGLVTDNNCVYIHHSTYNFQSISFCLRFALIRKLFTLAGVPVVNRFEELPLLSATNSIGFRLEYLHYNPLSGAQTAVGYNTVDNETLTDVTNSFVAFDTLIENYMSGGFPNVEPLKLLLYTADLRDVGSTEYRLAAQLNISDEEIHMNIFSNIKVQNRTAGDTATAGDRTTDRIDSQPLVCTVFEFTSGDPRIRSSTNYGTSVGVLNGCHANTVKLLRAGSVTTPLSFGAVNEFQNAPPKAIFNNCNKMSKTIINPGEIKEAIVSYSVVGKGLAFFQKLCYRGLSGNIVSGVHGKSQMLCFEEKMRTVGTNPVSVHYERKHKVSCYSVTKKTGFITPHLEIAEVNLP